MNNLHTGIKHAPPDQSGTALLGPHYCEPNGPMPVPMTPRGHAARSEVLRKIAQGEYRFQEVGCLCGAHSDRLVARVDRYRIPHVTVMCKVCGLLRTNPRLDNECYVDFYKNHYRAIYERAGHNENVFFAEQTARGEQRAAFIFKRCAPPTESPSVLEIGCGGGWNLLPFHQRGWKAVGWDFDSNYLESGRQRGLEMKLGSLDDAVCEGRKYHLAIMSHVLEHLLDPVASIKRLRGLLTPGGAIFIEVPNLFGVTSNLLRYFQSAHTYSFVPETLRMVMEAAGFRPRALAPPIQSLWISGPVGSSIHLPKATLAGRTEDFLWKRSKDSGIYQRYRGMALRWQSFVELVFPRRRFRLH